jgi:hypothetical protein
VSRRHHAYTCVRCGMVGHSAPTCHVAARGASDPDEHDERAQHLVASLGPGTNLPIGDVRKMIAALLRSGGRL